MSRILIALALGTCAIGQSQPAQPFIEFRGHLFQEVVNASLPNLNVGDTILDFQIMPNGWIMVAGGLHETVYQKVDGAVTVLLDNSNPVFNGQQLYTIWIRADGTLDFTTCGAIDCTAWRLSPGASTPQKLLAAGQTITVKNGPNAPVSGTVKFVTSAFQGGDGQNYISAFVQGSANAYLGTYKLTSDGLTLIGNHQVADFPHFGGLWATKGGVSYVEFPGGTLDYYDNSTGTNVTLLKKGTAFQNEIVQSSNWLIAPEKETYSQFVSYTTPNGGRVYRFNGSAPPEKIWGGETIQGLGSFMAAGLVAASQRVGIIPFVQSGNGTPSFPGIPFAAGFWDGNSISAFLQIGDALGGKPVEFLTGDSAYFPASYSGCTGDFFTLHTSGRLDREFLHFQPCIESATASNEVITLTGDNLQLPGYDPQVTVGSFAGKIVSASKTQVVVSTAGLPLGNQQAVVALGGRIKSNTFTVTVAAPVAPVPMVNAVVNAASSKSEPLSPDTWFSIFGTNLGDAAAWSGDPKTYSLGRASVTICGFPATLSYDSGDFKGGWQVNGLLPTAMSGKTSCPLILTVGTQSSNPFTIPVTEGTMELFQFSSSVGLLPIVTHGDQSLVGPVAAGLLPAKPGEEVVAWGTGSCGSPTITIGGKASAVMFAGAAGIGLCQFNFVVPENIATASGEATMAISTSPSLYQLEVSK